MNIFESLENLNVSEECFDDIMDIVEGILGAIDKSNHSSKEKEQLTRRALNNEYKEWSSAVDREMKQDPEYRGETVTGYHTPYGIKDKTMDKIDNKRVHTRNSKGEEKTQERQLKGLESIIGTAPAMTDEEKYKLRRAIGKNKVKEIKNSRKQTKDWEKKHPARKNIFSKD
jgi:hypothetical protein